MIGKIKIGKSFYHAISYLLEDKQELSLEQKLQMSSADGCQHLDRAEILYYNECSGDKKELIQDYSDVAHLSSRVEKPVLHLSLKLASGEHLDKTKWMEVAWEAARDFKLEKNQYIVVLHKDSKEEHIHILANRVGFEGKAISDSNSYRKVAALCRKLELQLALKQVLSPHVFLTPGQRLEHKLEHRIDQRKERMKEFIRNHLLQARDFTDFRLRMQRDGFTIQKGRGISFTDEKKVRFKGSQLGYSLSHIEKILAQSLDRRLELKQRLERERGQRPTAASDWLTKEKESKQLFMKKELPPELSIVKDLHGERLLNELMGPGPEQSVAAELTLEEELSRKRRKQQRPGL